MSLILADQISQRGADSLTAIRSGQNGVRDVLPPDECHSESLVFLSKSEHFNTALNRGARVFIIHDVLYKIIHNDLPADSTVWTTPNIQQAMIAVLGLFDRNREHMQGIHPAAYIHPTAKIGANCHIGPYAVIEAGAVIGDNVVIFPHAFIGANCRIGHRCQIGPHTTIGSDGFGFFTDRKMNHHKVPQIGKVVIEDDCEVGAQCAIDRATLTETRIGRGSKLDNFCHIAHNVKIGENAAIAAGFIVAGSTVIGKNFMASGGVHVLGHLKITDNVILTARSGVLQDIEVAGMYGGYPLEAHKESIKTLMSVPDIKKMRKQIKKIINHLQIEIED